MSDDELPMSSSSTESNSDESDDEKICSDNESEESLAITLDQVCQLENEVHCRANLKRTKCFNTTNPKFCVEFNEKSENHALFADESNVSVNPKLMHLTRHDFYLGIWNNQECRVCGDYGDCLVADNHKFRDSHLSICNECIQKSFDLYNKSQLPPLFPTKIVRIKK